MRGLAIPRSVVLVGVYLLTAAIACGPPDPPVTPQEIEKEPNAPNVPDPLKVVHATKTDAAACAKLRELGCVEGAPKRGKCEDTFEHARTNEPEPDRGKVEGVAKCVAGAASVAVVRTCGGPSTLTFECPNK